MKSILPLLISISVSISQSSDIWLSKDSSPYVIDIDIPEELKGHYGIALNIDISSPDGNEMGTINIGVFDDSKHLKTETIEVKQETMNHNLYLCERENIIYNDKIQVKFETNIANSKTIDLSLVKFDCSSVNAESSTVAAVVVLIIFVLIMKISTSMLLVLLYWNYTKEDDSNSKGDTHIPLASVPPATNKKEDGINSKNEDKAYNLTTSGEARTKFPQLMGVYKLSGELHNSFPVYKQDGGPGLAHVHLTGNWVVGKEYEKALLYSSKRPITPSPPESQWYYHIGNKEWDGTDSTLLMLPIDPGNKKEEMKKEQEREKDQLENIDKAYNLTSSGEARTKFPQLMGVYKLSGELHNSFPVYKQDGGPGLAHVDLTGDWVVGKEYEKALLYSSKRPITPSPPESYWYYHIGNKEWDGTDSTLLMLPIDPGQDEIFTSQAKHPNFSKLTQLEGSSIDRSADDTSLSSNSLNASSDGVLSNTNDPSCGYDSFWQELSLLDPTANRYTTRNINMKSLSKEWKYILRRLFPNDADGWIHSIQEIFGIEDMNHKMFTTFSILKKSIASGQLSIKLLDDKLYPILEKAKKKSQDESLQVVPGSPSSLHEYSADEILIKHHTTLIKKLLPNLAIPIINALHKLYETDEKKAIATQFILNRFCARKYVCLEAIEEAKDFLRRYDCNLLNHNRNFAFANLYQPTYDVIIDRDLPENLKDKETLKKEITHTLNGIKTNKRLRDWLIKIHDERSCLYGWEKIEGSLTEEDFQLVSFEVLDIFYGNKVHFTFKFITFKMEEPNQDDRCRLEKLNNVYRIALENIGNIMTNSNSIRFENNTIHISIMPEMETNIETVVLDQLRDVWGRACTDESYRDKLLNKLQEKFPNIDIPYNTSEDILSLFKNENYIDQDVDRLEIEFKKDGGDAKATLVNGYVLWPKMTRRLSELPNEWFSEFYGIFMQVIPEKFYKSIARTFICNASIYKKGENCSILMEEALNFKSENNLFGLFNHFRKNGGTVGELRLAIQECNTDDINLESQLNKEKITYIGTLIENIDFLIEDTYKKWKSRFETKLPGKITTRKVFENFFKQYGVSQMPKMNVSEFYQKIESGEIHKGDQIWFWRYRFLTDSYAHVGIFVDEESITDSNQVRDDLPPQKSIVHVTPRERAKLRHISRQEQSRIKCDSVQDAVHTNDEIFVVRYEGNADFSGEEIAKRALACCKPKITFNYNGHYGSCETFASKICGSTSVENLNLQGFQVAFEGGKKEVIANLLHREERFDDLIRQVDSRMMTLSRDSAEPLES